MRRRERHRASNPGDADTVGLLGDARVRSMRALPRSWHHGHRCRVEAARRVPGMLRRQIAAVVLLALVGCIIPCSGSSPSDSARRSSSPAMILVAQNSSDSTSGDAAASGYLLALGDSLAAAYQPFDGSSSPPIDPSTGFPDQGYAGGYASDLAAYRHLTLADLACPGETTTSMMGKPARARCAADYRSEFGASSQLSAAVAFLSEHKGQVQLASIDLGANDIESCTAHGAPDPSCLRKGTATANHKLPVILNTLKHALALDDPGAPLVGMNYYDPFLGLDFRPGGPKPSAEAFLSLVVLEAYNQDLASLYERANVPVADVASAFESERTAPLTTYGSRRLPRNVALVCRWTWMCPISPAKDSPDIHANTAGYRVIAGAFETVLAGS